MSVCSCQLREQPTLRWVFKDFRADAGMETGFHAGIGQNTNWNHLLKIASGLIHSVVCIIALVNLKDVFQSAF